jgi:DNA gyrase subunit A
MEMGIVRQINIDTEMQASYLDYAMSVIVARALPDVRDGLKPVHRRILYAMHDLGLRHDTPYKKSARIVGEVLGKYHPHGDAAVYEAMVRMAQDFSLRYPLVDGQGNFGSIDGDNAAAMRYTEARLAPIAAEMLADIHKDTVDWVDNFDGTLKEPSVLPAALPNLLVNGSSGIAVGMSTSIPPHNLGEVCDALCYLIDNQHRIEDVTIEDLMRFIPGPDFPTGGVVYRYREETNAGQTEQVDVIAHAYASGKGRVVIQAKAHIEEMTRNRSRIVVTELPYQTDKSNLLERIAELVRDGRLDGITDLRDESDRTGMRICIEMTRTVEPREVLAQLFKLTPLQGTFSVSLLALVDGEPRHLSLKRMLQHFIEHRQEVIIRRSNYDLAKARQRAEVLEGLLRALDMLDEVIALIRRSRTADTAKRNLIEQFKFTEIQAQAILDMQLRRLAALERRKLDEEYRQTLALIKELEELLNSPAKVLALIRRNLTDLKARYGDARRTQIADRTKGALTARDVLPDQDVWVTLSAEGLLSRVARAGNKHPLLASGGLPAWCLPVNTRQDLYLLSARGQATRIPAYQVPDGVGAHYADISGLTRRDRIVAVCAFPQSHGEEPAAGYLLLGTVQGKVKRAALADVAAQAHTNPQVLGLDSSDDLAWADISAGAGEFLLVTANGQTIRFSEEDVRAMGLPAGGIGGIKLRAKDRVIAGCGIPANADSQTSVAFITGAGFGKRVRLTDFPAQGRNGQGVMAGKTTSRSGEFAGAALVTPGDLLACLVSNGAVKSLLAAGLPEASRASLGRSVLSLPGGEQIQAVYAALGAGAGDSSAPTASSRAKPATRRSTASTRARRASAAVAKASKQPVASLAPEPEVAPPATKAAAAQAPPEPEASRRPSRRRRAGATVAAATVAAAAPPPSKAAAEPSAAPTPRKARAKTTAKAEADQLSRVAPSEKEALPATPERRASARRTTPKPAPETQPAKPATRRASRTPATKSPAGAPAVKSSQPAPRGKAAPAEEISVKELKGRSISRSDLEKLIRGEISELPSSARPAAKPATEGAKAPAASSSQAKATSAPSGKTSPGSSRKTTAPSGKTTSRSSSKTPTPSDRSPAKTPASSTKSSSGAASSKPSAKPAAPSKTKTTPAGRSKPSGATSKPVSESSSSTSKTGSVKPEPGAAKPAVSTSKSSPAKPSSGAAKPPVRKQKNP